MTRNHYDGQAGAMTEKKQDQITSDHIQFLAGFWQQKVDAGHLPGRAEIDPAELPSDILPWLIITELQGPPLRARFRLVGTGIAEIQGDFTGLWADELQSEKWLAKWLNQYQRLQDTKKPLFGDEAVTWHGSHYTTYEWALFPLASDGEHVDMVLEIEDHPNPLSVSKDPDMESGRGLPFGTHPRKIGK